MKEHHIPPPPNSCLLPNTPIHGEKKFCHFDFFSLFVIIFFKCNIKSLMKNERKIGVQ